MRALGQANTRRPAARAWAASLKSALVLPPAPTKATGPPSLSRAPGAGFWAAEAGPPVR